MLQRKFELLDIQVFVIVAWLILHVDFTIKKNDFISPLHDGSKNILATLENKKKKFISAFSKLFLFSRTLTTLEHIETNAKDMYTLSFNSTILVSCVW